MPGSASAGDLSPIAVSLRREAPATTVAAIQPRPGQPLFALTPKACRNSWRAPSISSQHESEMHSE